MTPEEQEALQYRFSGYQLPLVQFDETGPAYAQLDVHPYYKSQPAYWQKNAFQGNSFPNYGQVINDRHIDNSANSTNDGLLSF